MQRSGGITVIALFAIVGSLLCFAMSCLMVLPLVVAPHPSVDQPGGPLVKVGMIFTIIFFLGLAIWGFLSSLGLFRLRRWARISTLIFSGLLAFFGIMSPLFILAMQWPQTPGAGSAIVADIKSAFTGFYLILAAVGIWWLIYLTRPAVKAQFEDGFVPEPPSRRPLSISIIAWFLIATCCLLPIDLPFRMPILMFGTLLFGWAASFVVLGFSAVSLIAGVGLLRLRNYGRALAIAYFIFGILNAAVSYLLPGSTERFSRIMDALRVTLREPTPQPFNPLALAAVTIPIMLVPIYFLVKNRQAFVEPAPAPDPPPLATA